MPIRGVVELPIVGVLLIIVDGEMPMKGVQNRPSVVLMMPIIVVGKY